MKNCLFAKKNISFHVSGSSSIIQLDSYFAVDIAVRQFESIFLFLQGRLNQSLSPGQLIAGGKRNLKTFSLLVSYLK